MLIAFQAEDLTLGNATIVYFPAEMFNDAMYFLEEAKKLSTSSDNDFLRWRYLRASIIYSFISLEAFANTQIAALIAEKTQASECCESLFRRAIEHANKVRGYDSSYNG